MLALDMEHVAIDAAQFEQDAQDALRRRDVPVFESALAVLSKLLAGAAAHEPPVCDAALFDVLDHALQIGLLEECTRGYAFRYPLIRAALYEGLSRHRHDQLKGAVSQC